MHVSELAEQRTALRADTDTLLTRAADESRDLTPDELRERARLVAEIREVEDALDAARDTEIRELRAAALAAATTPTGPIENRYGHWLLEQRANTVDSSTMSGKGRSPLVNDVQSS